MYDKYVGINKGGCGVEIINAQGEKLGFDGLIQILKGLGNSNFPLSMAALEKELLKCSNDIRLKDDLTIIEMKFIVYFASAAVVGSGSWELKSIRKKITKKGVQLKLAPEGVKIELVK